MEVEALPKKWLKRAWVSASSAPPPQTNMDPKNDMFPIWEVSFANVYFQVERVGFSGV